MAIRTKEELMEAVKAYIGDNDDDATIEIIEDISDTIDSLTPAEDEVDWQAKYEANDAEWRQRYRDRFFDGGEERDADRHEEALPDTEEEVEVAETFDDLFEEVNE